MPRYSGKNWSRVAQIYIRGSANVMIENCSIKENDGEIALLINENSRVVVYGGVYYFDPTKFLDANTYKATQTKDAAGADIWVVTKK